MTNYTYRLLRPKLDHVLRHVPSFLGKVQGRIRWEEHHHPSGNHAANIQDKLSQFIEQPLVGLLGILELQEGICRTPRNTKRLNMRSWNDVTTGKGR